LDTILFYVILLFAYKKNIILQKRQVKYCETEEVIFIYIIDTLITLTTFKKKTKRIYILWGEMLRPHVKDPKVKILSKKLCQFILLKVEN
jgi:hypothetical protein